VLNTYVDDVMRLILKELEVQPVPYDAEVDPTRQKVAGADLWCDDFTKKEWTIGQRVVSTTRKRLSGSILPITKPVKKRRKKDEEDDAPVEPKTEPEPEPEPETTDLAVVVDAVVGGS